MAVMMTERVLVRPGQSVAPEAPRDLVLGAKYRLRAPGDDRYRDIATLTGSYAEERGNEVVDVLRFQRRNGREVEVLETQVGALVLERRRLIR